MTIEFWHLHHCSYANNCAQRWASQFGVFLCSVNLVNRYCLDYTMHLDLVCRLYWDHSLIRYPILPFNLKIAPEWLMAIFSLLFDIKHGEPNWEYSSFSKWPSVWSRLFSFNQGRPTTSLRIQLLRAIADPDIKCRCSLGSSLNAS